MQPRKLSDLELLVHSFPLRYLGYDFPRLIGSAVAIENELISEIVEFTVSRIECVPGVSDVNYDIFLYKGTPFQIVHASAINSRTLAIFVQEIGKGVQEGSLAPIACNISEFGLINRIEIFAPPDMSDHINLTLADASRVLRSAYIALQDSFITKYLQWRFSIFDTIYALTNTHLRILGDDRLVGRYWFSVTNLRDIKFRYQFDRVAIERAVEWFKSHQGQLSSPFYALCFLLIEEANDAVFGNLKFDTKPEQISDSVMILPFTRLPHYKLGQADFWVAERQLYGSEAMACIDVVTLDDLSLQLNCPVDEYERYGAALAASSQDIRNIFIENKKRYSKDLRVMASKLDGLRQNSGIFREITTDIIAKFAAELTKAS